MRIRTVPILVGDELEERLAEHAVDSPAEHVRERCVRKGRFVLAVQEPDSLGGSLHDHPVALLTVPKSVATRLERLLPKLTLANEEAEATDDEDRREGDCAEDDDPVQGPGDVRHRAGERGDENGGEHELHSQANGDRRVLLGSIAEGAHAGMQRGCPDQRVRHHPQRVEPRAGRIGLVQERECIEAVCEEPERHSAQKQPERWQTDRRSEQESHERHERHGVCHGIGQSDAPGERIRLGLGDERLDQELPAGDDGGDRNERRVKAISAPKGAATAGEQQRSEREQRVAGEVERVGQRRERRLLPEHALVQGPDQVTRRETGQRGGNAQPRGFPARPVDPDTCEHRSG